MDDLINKRINEVLKGNQDAFEEIVTLFQHRLYHVCFRMLSNRQEAEDIAQEAFVRAYVNIHTFDQKRKFSTGYFELQRIYVLTEFERKSRIIILTRMCLEQKDSRCIHKLQRPANCRKRKL